MQVVPAHRRGDRRGRRRGRGRGAHARPRLPLDGAHVLLGERPASTRTTRRRIDQTKLSRRGQVLEQGRRRRASTGSTRSSRSRGPTSWPATTATRSATSTPSRRRTSRTRTTRRRTSSRRSSTSRTASTTTPLTIVAKFRAEVSSRFDDELAKILEQFKRATNQEEEFYKFLKDVRDDKATLTPQHRVRSSRRALGSAAPPQPRVRARARRGGGALQEGAEQLPELDARQRRQGLRCSSRATSPSATPGELARERYQRNLDELNEHLRDGAEDPDRHHGRPAQPARSGHRKARRSPSKSRRPTSSSPTKSTSSGRSTASTGVTSSASTARRSRRSAGGNR